ncbi:hypothetical protein RB595_004942 [Gaeumannomyces hyphopodioides]
MAEMALHGNPRPEESAGMAPPLNDAEGDNGSDVDIPSDSESDWEEPEMPAELAELSEEEFFKPTVERNRYRMHPMQEALTVPWDVPVSAADVERLKVGFRSRSMDDKWDLLVEDPDDKGGWSIHIIRSGGSYDTCFVLHLAPSQQLTDGATGGGGTKITAFTWDGKHSGLQVPEEQAKKDAIMLCRAQLGCEFDALPKYSWDTEFWQNRRKLDEA